MRTIGISLNISRLNIGEIYFIASRIQLIAEIYIAYLLIFDKSSAIFLYVIEVLRLDKQAKKMELKITVKCGQLGSCNSINSNLLCLG